MAKAFSLASWNVEHFKDDPTRVDRVVDYLAEQGPDVFGLYEVEGGAVFAALTGRMPGYTFHITEGPQTQEILVGVRKPFTAFFTQKLTFKSGESALRPGALLTLTIAGENYSILFLHTKSANTPKGLGLRDDQFARALDFKKTLDRKVPASSGGRARYIFLGDLNTMGMKYPYSKSIDAEVELRKLDSGAKRVKMRRLTKDVPATWWNGPGTSIAPSNLDQVVAADELSFRSFGGFDVSVRGWPKEPTDAAKAAWIKDYSDHGLLYLEVQKV